MKNLLKRLISHDDVEQQARQYYAELVTQSRTTELYTHCGIPDTLDGRFEAVILHVFMEEIRLKSSQDTSEQWLRLLHESFFADMDRSLREGGVGDTGISKRVQRMASGFYGRLTSYHDAWGDDAAFKDALLRNAYGTCETPPTPEQIETLTQYIERALAASNK